MFRANSGLDWRWARARLLDRASSSRRRVYREPVRPVLVLDELEAELEELEGAELEEQLLQPATTAPANPAEVHARRQPPKKVEDEDDELAELQREMAL